MSADDALVPSIAINPTSPLGDRWFKGRHFQTTLHPIRGMVCPSPFPLPAASKPWCLGALGPLFEGFNPILALLLSMLLFSSIAESI